MKAASLEVARSFRIRVFEDLGDESLKASWNRLLDEGDYFPQHSYDWCAAWWRHFGDEWKLHVLAATAGEEVVGLAPLAISRKRGVRVLASIPHKFGDYYTFLVRPGDSADAVVDALLKALRAFSGWDVVTLAQVSSEDRLSKRLSANGVKSRQMAGSITAILDVGNWQDYLRRVSRNLREDVKKKRKLLERRHAGRLIRIEDAQEFGRFEPLIWEMYSRRWSDDHLPEPDLRWKGSSSEALRACFARRECRLYMLEADGQPIAYRVGFVKNRAFYDWWASYEPSWSQLSPGRLIISYVVEDLIKDGFEKLDFMAGKYDYKESWSPVRSVCSIDMFVLDNGGLLPKVYASYQLRWRDRARAVYQHLIAFRLFRRFSRWMLGLGRDAGKDA